MKERSATFWRADFSPIWFVLSLGVLAGLFAVILPTYALILTTIAFLVSVTLLVYLGLTPGLLEACMLLVIVWFFVTESIVGSRYFHLDWAFSQLIVRLQGVIPGAIFGLVIVYLVLSHRKWYRGLVTYELWLTVFLVLGFGSGLVGLIRGNNVVYLLGDTFKYVFFPLAYFAVAVVSRTMQSRKWVFGKLVVAGLVYNVVALLMQSWNFLVLSKATLGRGMDYLSWIYLLLVLGHWREHQHGKVRYWWAILLAVLVLLAGILSLERRDWVFIICAILGVVWVARRRVSTVRTIVAVTSVLVLMSAILAVVFIEQFGALIDVVVNRIEFTFEAQSGLDRSSLQRFVEIRVASEYALQSGGIANFLWGMGSGAVYYSPVPVPSHSIREGAPQTGFYHQIHNTYFSVLFRMGIIGLTIFMLFLISLLFRTWRHLCVVRRNIRTDPRQMDRFLLTATLLLFLVITVAVAWNVGYGIGHIQAGIVLGLLGAELRDKEPVKESVKGQ
ncbi:MAG: O-antigen ligase family protein [Anaerolineae bacterium]|nr:O-antigen ligase family protein [Anaerolineae bacterium]